MDKLYASLEKAKNGSIIPLLYNGKTLESKYNPDNEAEKIICEYENSCHYFIVTGICSGILINKLLEKNPNCFILCIERSTNDIEFLKQLSLVKKLSNKSNIIFTTSSNLFDNIINSFLPAKYVDVKIIERRSWIQENKDLILFIQKQIQKAINIVSADYSVQVHFGKIWQYNIMNNLKLLSNINTNNLISTSDIQNSSLNVLTKTIAYIIAAGPSLDNKISILKNKPNIFIISTDTAYSSLIKNNIIPDVVISIDGQEISKNHFINFSSDKTLFLFDLCSNTSASKHIINSNKKLIFFNSGHPLSTLVTLFANNESSFINLFTGSGTVTIAATDLAVKLGFSKIIVLGADFGYLNGKCYTKGTYFDTIFNTQSNRTSPLEKKYTMLQYRTKLIEQKDNLPLTNQILNAYKTSFEKYLHENNCTYTLNDYEYIITNPNKNKIIYLNPKFSYEHLINYLKTLTVKELEIPLLPYIAFLRNKNSQQSFDDLLNLAYSNFVSYNM